jgi:hypothetical protein
MFVTCNVTVLPCGNLCFLETVQKLPDPISRFGVELGPESATCSEAQHHDDKLDSFSQALVSFRSVGVKSALA